MPVEFDGVETFSPIRQSEPLKHRFTKREIVLLCSSSAHLHYLLGLFLML